MGKGNLDAGAYLAAIEGCKESRTIGMCERSCVLWHANQRKRPAFCAAAGSQHRQSEPRTALR